MCGIYGIVSREGIRADDVPVLSALGELLEHRGPDEGNQLVTERVALGIQRLSIIDLAHGMQPLWNERRTIALVANGEIYNFVELRQELEGRGHHFASGSDCEVIVHLYEEREFGCLDRLRGMFAFALVDFERRRMILARDRMGEKPLYIAESDGRIVFASELQALVGAGVVPFVMDDVAVRDYFLWGFVPEPDSAVVGTRKLPAGTYLDISLDDWFVKQRRWWTPLDAAEVDGNPVERIGEVLDEIGPLVVRSDVPVGVALSSGVESSLLAALACEHARGEVNTFTVGYEGNDRNDESKLAQQFAATLDVRHHSVILESAQAIADFPRMCQLRDDPIADISGPAYLAVMEAASAAGVPVLLFGHGGDELSWGYPWTADAVSANLRKAALLSGQVGLKAYSRPARPVLTYSQALTWGLGAFGLAAQIRAWQSDSTSPAGQMIFWNQLSQWNKSSRALPSLMAASFMDRVAKVPPERRFTFASLPERPDLAITDLLLGTYLLGNGIAQADRLSMSTSVECRLPFTDYRLVETVIGLRKRTEDWSLPPKHWLRGASASYLPQDILARPKRGFTPPYRKWSNGILREHGGALIDGVLVEAGVLRNPKRAPKPVDGLLRTNPLAMLLLTLEMWARGMRDLERSAIHRVNRL